MKHKLGDKVTVRKDLKTSTIYGNTCATDIMLEHLGKKATITDVLITGYSLDIDDGIFCWADEMFEEEKPKTTLVDSIIVDMDRVLLKLDGLLKAEKSKTRKAMIREIIVDMKVSKKIL